MNDNEIGDCLFECGLKVHRALGPGLLESVYETCLAHELAKLGLDVKRQLALPVVYDGITMEGGYRIDLLINGQVVVEVKSIERIAEIQRAQLLTYLRLGGYRLGYVLNFNVPLFKSGIARVLNGY